MIQPNYFQKVAFKKLEMESFAKPALLILDPNFPIIIYLSGVRNVNLSLL